MPPTPPRDRRDFETAIICALPLEADAVHAVFDKFYKDEGKNYGQAPGDYNYYTTGVIGEHNVVLACMPGMGNVNAAGLAASLLASFNNIKLALVVGICGGVPFGPGSKEEIFLGDIVFSTGVIQYDFGRQYPKVLRRKDTIEESLGRPPRSIRGLIAQLKTKMYRKELQTMMTAYLEILQRNIPEAKRPDLQTDLLFESSYLHKHRDFSTGTCQECNAGPKEICDLAPITTCQSLKCDPAMIVKRYEIQDGKTVQRDDNPSVHFGVIGSGNTVMKSGEHRDRIAKEIGVIAFEMEGAGVWDFFPSVIIKGVCDYADSHKNREWQEYAAAAAASGMKAFLRQWAVHENEEATTSQVLWHIPFSIQQEFVGRKQEIEVLETRLFQRRGRSRVAVFGLGGIGKTRLALEVACRTRTQHPACMVFWVQTMDALMFHNSIMEIGKILKIPGIDDDGADVKNLVKQRLNQHDAGEWLMILDNADDEDLWGPKPSKGRDHEQLIQFLPDNGRVLITTRSRQVAAYMAGKDSVELPDMTQEEAVDTLKSVLIDHAPSDNAEMASKLVEKLAYLPLAIVQAASYINMNDATIRNYLNLLEDTEENVIDLLSEDFDSHKRHLEQQNPVASTWLISFERMRARRPRAAEYLTFASCLSEKSIPLSLLPDPASKRDLVEVMGTLTGYSFLRKQNEESAGEVLYQMHRLVRLATRNWLRKQSKLFDSIRMALKIVEKRFPIRTYENRDECALYLPHAQLLCDSEGISDLEERFSLMEKVGICLVAGVKLTDALKLHYSVVAWREQHCGLSHSTTLAAYSNYGEALRTAGDYIRARPYLERASEGLQSLLGFSDRLTLVSMDSLVLLYQGLGLWEEAEELSSRLIEASKKTFGPENPETLSYMINSVWTLYNQKRMFQARRLGLQLKEASIKVLSEEHPDALDIIAQLGAIHQSLNETTQAIELKTKVLRIRTRVLGAEHPQTLTSMVNLALTYRAIGRLDEAEALEVKALEMCERVLGADHPYTLTGMNNLAWAWRNQGREAEAIMLMKKCISLSIEKLGPDHQITRQRRFYWDDLIKGS